MKTIMCSMMMVVILGCSVVGMCEEFEKTKSTSGSITLKNNWVAPRSGENVFFQTFALFLQTPSALGIGGDFTYQPKGAYVEYAPYLTLNNGPHYALLGISTNSLNCNYAQTGYWYFNKHAGFDLVADIRAYIGTSEKSKSFLDNYFEASYPITSEIKLGLVVEDVYLLAGSSNKFLLGPIMYYNVSKSVIIFERYLHAWSESGGGSTQSDTLRLGISYVF